MALLTRFSERDSSKKKREIHQCFHQKILHRVTILMLQQRGMMNGTRFTVQCERNRGTMIQRSIPIKRRMNKETRGFELFEHINYYHV